MIISGILIAESPVYRGNARKTIFTRDDDGKHRLVSLAGEVSGTAQALMDAFIGSSRNKKKYRADKPDVVSALRRATSSRVDTICTVYASIRQLPQGPAV